MPERIILFDEESSDVHSEIFSVLMGTVVVLTAWGFTKEKRVKDPGDPTNIEQRALVEKLAFADGGFFVGDSTCVCNSDGPIRWPEVMYAEDVQQCGGWNLNACQNVGILSVPGVYRLRFNDVGAPGFVVIYADVFDIKDVYVPPRLVFGGF